jgi:hypothetical protein
MMLEFCHIKGRFPSFIRRFRQSVKKYTVRKGAMKGVGRPNVFSCFSQPSKSYKPKNRCECAKTGRSKVIEEKRGTTAQ